MPRDAKELCPIFREGLAVNIRAITDLTTKGNTQLGDALTDKIGFYGKTPIAQQASANQAGATQNVANEAPAGGTGAAAGAWDTAAHRNTAIGTINDTRALALQLKTLTNEIRSVLVDLGLMKGEA